MKPLFERTCSEIAVIFINHVFKKSAAINILAWIICSRYFSIFIVFCQEMADIVKQSVKRFLNKPYSGYQ